MTHILPGYVTKSLLAVTLLASSFALVACNEEQSASIEPAAGGSIAATVNGAPIYNSALDSQLANIPAELLQGREADIRQQLLNQLIEQQLIDQAAAKLNADADPAYQEQLANIERQLKQNFVLAKHVEQALTEDRINARYEETKQQRAYPAVRARHILVDSETTARELLTAVTPQNFADMAREHSTGPTGPNGGDLGYFAKEAMVPAFAEVAFNTAPGTIAKAPVQTQFGWHIVFVEDKQDAFVPPLVQVQDAIRNELTQQIIQDYMAKLRSDAQIDITVTDAAPAEPTPASGADAS